MTDVELLRAIADRYGPEFADAEIFAVADQLHADIDADEDED